MTSVAFTRDDSDAFAALRDGAAERFGLQPGVVEKDYWALEVLRSITEPFDGVEAIVFKGGTSLSKVYGIIERFSEDIDVIAVLGDDASANSAKRTLRGLSERAAADLGVEYERTAEGRGFLNTRFQYRADFAVSFLSPGVLLELGSRGGPEPNQQHPVTSFMAEAAAEIDPTSIADFADLQPVIVTALVPERTLAEKLAFLHHRATVHDLEALTRGARHLYDVHRILGHGETTELLDSTTIADLMDDVDERSATAGWGYTPRPSDGFAASPAFHDPSAAAALAEGFADVRTLVWGVMPTVDEAIATVIANADRM